jgi:precorrin-6B methylase 2
MIRAKIIDKLPWRHRFFFERLYYRYLTGGHLRADVAVLKKLCNPDKTAIDIGAFHGTISLFLCKFARHVYCFEPIPTVVEQLRHKFTGSNVTIENCALGDIDQELTLSIPSFLNYDKK